MATAWLDSSFFRPSRDQALRAKADGVGGWGGYLATRSRVGLASPWDLASFDVVRALAGKPIAYCSGWDDPQAVRALALAWDVRPALDVEGGGLRPDGGWVQPWLDAGGTDLFGLYGNYGVFAGRHAAFYVVGGYPGYDPGRTWGYVARPSGPCGWQWRGSHDEYGGGVDRCWFDDWFAQGAVAPEEEESEMWLIQGDEKPEVYLTNGLARRWVANWEEFVGWLKTTKKPLEKKRQYDVDRIPVSFRVPEDLTGTGLIGYDNVVFGPPPVAVPADKAKMMLELPADAWAPTDEEIARAHEQLGFYPVVGAPHKA